MICLGIETSGKHARVALMENGRIVATHVAEVDRTHSETLLPLISEAMIMARISFSEVTLIGVGTGPGAWTGLRMGVTTAKALAFSLGMPLVGISTFESVAAGAVGYVGRLAVILDARRGEVCGKLFRIDGRGEVASDGEVFVVVPEAVIDNIGTDCALTGNGVALVPDAVREGRTILQEACWEADAAVLCRRAAAYLESSGPSDPAAVMPIYVRGSDAELGLDKKALPCENKC